MKGGPRVRCRFGGRKKPIVTLADALKLRDERDAIRRRLRELEPRLALLNRKVAAADLLIKWRAEQEALTARP